MATRKNSTEKTPNTSAPEGAIAEGAGAAVEASTADAPKPAPRKRGPKPRLAQPDAAAAAPTPAKPAAAKRGPAKPGPAKRAPTAAEGGRKPAGKPGRKPAAPTPKPLIARVGTVGWSLGGLALAAGAGLVAFLTRGRIAALIDRATASTPVEGHVPTDLLDPGRNADDRAVADFRPNMDAPMTAGERAALAPATGPSPSLVADRGDLRSEVGPTG